MNRSGGGEVPTADLVRVAERAVSAGGEYLAGEFRRGCVEGEYTDDDVKAGADREAETRVVEVIREAFPTHAVHAEEAGRSGATDGEAAYEWVVDPLDGTNNFASGLPVFASAVAVRNAGETLVAAVDEPVPGDTYVAGRGAGATVNGEAIAADSDVGLANGTVSLAVGLDAVRDPSLSRTADDIVDVMDAECKRVLETWAPCVDFGLLARGGTEGLVAFHPDPYEQHAGALLASEAGAVSRREGPLYVAASDAETVEKLWQVVGDAVGGD
jgi:myo-inositol-1(or 4)-monophosphatase